MFSWAARNGNQTTIHLTLLDVNDNAPQMPSKTDYEINENANEVQISMSLINLELQAI